MEMKKPANQTERLFVAIKLPAEVREAMGRISNRLSQQLRFAKWTFPEDYHITLQFLGDTPVEDIPAIIKALKQVAAESTPFELTLQEWGTFGTPAAPRVLWAGLSGDMDKLKQLQQKVTLATLPLGFTAEAREYNPHLTMARKYRGDTPFSADWLQDLRMQEVEVESSLIGSYWTIDSIMVYATMMHAIPMYEIIENITFF
ncbi:RNA 2',3'-cyclic phosphodiesterase [Paenibacillus sp. 19GGS1-52]|uniref:RNA 2',3'-cyclic phosphodiesterase n=1 Tax=Paenibacillus sp. 19GGS1-52 TaxID=2758563 RepID=UPI001EFB3408|nr:RNA 2',3'-cyclic phosphodiesterase [Paenibacillus sp. 19GGS1-52]ULO06658.1 RNA 2',3'-cyclic phosphodiesterase [Paenibacillus sp. 19GGS1-52]